MNRARVRRRPENEWLTLGEAARLLGVDATTLRGWADAGRVRVFRTPGRHRRFSEADVTVLLEASPPPAGRLDAVQSRSAPREWMASRPWYARLDEASRGQARSLCRQMMESLSAYLADTASRPRCLALGRSLGAALGREVSGWGLTPAQSTEVFLHFKMMVTEALAAPPQGTFGQVRSMRDADVFLGEVLQAMLEAHEEGRGSS